jgi:hypothetical protein
MTRLEKCETLKNKGYTYEPETGKIFGVYGKEITKKHTKGYIFIDAFLLAHHFAWYWVYGNVDYEMLDHINRDKTDNKISNLRIVDAQQNSFNKTQKGYSWHKRNNKWQSSIRVNKKLIYIGSFDTEEEARNAYLEAKEKYHIID